jgi:hypothetical protein
MGFIRSLHTWTWSVDPGDWKEGADIVSLVFALGSVDDGDVVLLHDWLEPRVPYSTGRSPTIGAVRNWSPLCAAGRSRWCPCRPQTDLPCSRAAHVAH